MAAIPKSGRHAFLAFRLLHGQILKQLRKEAGTLVNSQHGLNEAKNFLRHSSIATTAAYYVGSKGNITTGLS
jgi:hypothetical protein